MSKVFFIVGFVIGFELFLAITAENIILAIPSIVLVLASVAVLLYVYGLDFKAIVNVLEGLRDNESRCTIRVASIYASIKRFYCNLCNNS